MKLPSWLKKKSNLAIDTDVSSRYAHILEQNDQFLRKESTKFDLSNGKAVSSTPARSVEGSEKYQLIKEHNHQLLQADAKMFDLRVKERAEAARARRSMEREGTVGVGLRNRDLRTCYANAALQVLAHTNTIRNHCLEASYDPSSQPLTSAFCHQIEKMTQGSGRARTTRSLLKKIPGHRRFRWGGYSRVFMLELLDVMKDEVGGESNVFEKMFRCMTRTTARCSLCGSERSTLDPVRVVLNWKDADEDLVDLVHREISCESSVQKDHCETCGTEENAEVSKAVDSWPDQLMVRVLHHGDVEPIRLSVAEDTTYTIYATIDQGGFLPHIQTVCQVGEHWYQFNDGKTPKKDPDFDFGDAHLYFYKKN